jgi:hypothetical protein
VLDEQEKLPEGVVVRKVLRECPESREDSYKGDNVGKQHSDVSKRED